MKKRDVLGNSGPVLSFLFPGSQPQLAGILMLVWFSGAGGWSAQGMDGGQGGVVSSCKPGEDEVMA